MVFKLNETFGLGEKKKKERKKKEEQKKNVIHMHHIMRIKF